MTTATDSNVSMIAAALDFAERGFPIVPMHNPVGGGCSCGSDCKSPGKHPRIATGKGHGAATCDDEQVRQWWATWPDANIAMLTGARAGWFVVDIDPRHGGYESLAQLETKYGPLPRTVEAATGGGGSHLFYHHPGERMSCAAIAPGVDVKSDGGLILVSPSLHASGQRYRWVRHPETCELRDAPAWLLDLVYRQAAA